MGYCEPFSLFLTSHPNRPGYMRLPITETKHLSDGRWRMSLREIAFKRNELELWKAEPIYFLFLYDDASTLDTFRNDVYHSKSPEKLFEMHKFPAGHFQHFQCASVFSAIMKRSAKVVSSPGGYLDMIQFIKSSCLSPFRSTKFQGPRLEFNDNKVQIHPGTILRSVPKELYGMLTDPAGDKYFPATKVKIFPIFGPLTRQKLGLPSPLSHEFKALIDQLHPDDESDKWITTTARLTNSTGDLIVTCNVAESNGFYGGDLKNRLDTDGRMLRLVTPSSQSKHGDASSISFDSKNEILVPVRGGVFDEIIVRIIDEHTLKEIEYQNPIRVTLNFQRPTEVSKAPLLWTTLQPRLFDAGAKGEAERAIFNNMSLQRPLKAYLSAQTERRAEYRENDMPFPNYTMYYLPWETMITDPYQWPETEHVQKSVKKLVADSNLKS